MAGRYVVHLLDVGREKYGDSILVTVADRRILIDGAHPGDWRPRDGFPSLPDQLREILDLAEEEVIHLDLLVVTHCHSDHIGCLPRLVANGTLTCDLALVADPDLGFGRIDADHQDAEAGLSPRLQGMIAALLEENRSDLPDAALAQFLTDAASLEPGYRAMLDQLESAGTRVIRYRRPGDARAVEGAFRGLGLDVLGPSERHLRVCAEVIGRLRERAHDALVGRGGDAAAASDVALYRSIAGPAPQPDSPVISEDRPGKGAALNDQSIVLALGPEGARSLLTGDMQFAKAEVAGLEATMRILRRSAAGDYAFVKVAHHGSYNGLDADVLAELGESALFGISGGTDDAGHPDPGVLELLRANASRLKWLRTDRNGLCSITLEPGREPGIAKSRGRLSDPRPNAADLAVGTVGAAGALPALPAAVPALVPAVPAPVPAAPVMRAQVGSTDRIELSLSVPHAATRVTLTLDVAPAPSAGDGRAVPPVVRPAPRPAPAPGDLRLAGGRNLPRLLFVTQEEALRGNIGESEAASALQMIERAGQRLVRLSRSNLSPRQAAGEVRGALADEAGIVLVGGYDVVPSSIIDALGPELRGRLEGNTTFDEDNFIIWTDDVYGRTETDPYATPVSRIPDARSAELVFAALGAGSRLPGPPRDGVRRAGVANALRPFAGGVFERLPGDEKIRFSEPLRSPELPQDGLNREVVYLMLHGAHWDTRSMWGEGKGVGLLEAVTVGHVAPVLGAIVLCGACWGGLTVKSPAALQREGEPLSPRLPEASIALTFLARGANAFVGCTGTHYSPLEAPYDYFGGPLHHLFWEGVLAGKQPARALQQAKRSYLDGIPHRFREPRVEAVEYKLLQQFTCLGLAW